MTGYKVVIFNILALVLLVLGDSHFLAFIPTNGTEIITGIVVVINLILRFFTNTTVFKTTSPAPMPIIQKKVNF